MATDAVVDSPPLGTVEASSRVPASTGPLTVLHGSETAALAGTSRKIFCNLQSWADREAAEAAFKEGEDNASLPVYSTNVLPHRPLTWPALEEVFLRRRR